MRISNKAEYISFKELKVLSDKLFLKRDQKNRENFFLKLDDGKKISLTWNEISKFTEMKQVKVGQSKSLETLEIKEKQILQDPFKALIYLDFEQENSYSLLDISNHFLINYSNFVSMKHIRSPKVTGGYMVSNRYSVFNTPENRIELLPNNSMGNIEDDPKALFEKSFAIHFYLLPKSSRMEMVVLRMGIYDEELFRGFQIKIQDRNLAVTFDNLLSDSQKNLFSSGIVSKNALSTSKWNRVIIVYNNNNRQLRLYINNKMDSILNLTKNKGKTSEYLKVDFSKLASSLISLGTLYRGYLDEFIWLESKNNSIFQELRDLGIQLDNDSNLSRVSYDDVTEKMEVPIGIIESRPIDLMEYGVILNSFSANIELGTKHNYQLNPVNFSNKLPIQANSDTSIQLQVRSNDFLFAGNDNREWIDLDLETEKLPVKVQGRFFQWRARLFGNHRGTDSVKLNKIHFSFRKQKVPFTPNNLLVDSVSSKRIELSWDKAASKKFVGYRVYYGLNPDTILGFIDFINGKRITNDSADKNNRIKMTITNSVINENREMNSHKELSFLNFPLLKNHVLYFFQVAAYDDYGMTEKIGKNFFSALTEKVAARPIPGKE